MKILFVHPRLNVLGGAESVLIHMLKALREHELSLLADCWNLKDVKKMFDVELPDVKWVRCPSFHPTHQHFVAFQWLYYTKKLNQLIRELCGDYDLLIETQQVYSDPSGGTPLINYIHYPTLAAPSSEEEQHLTSSIYYAMSRFFIRQRVKKISLALASSQFVAKKIVEYLNIKPLVVHPPVNIKRFYSEQTWSDREDKVVSIGMFIPWKRLHLLLEVARRLPNIQFVIIGKINEEHKDYYENLCIQKTNNVTIKHNISSDEVKHELATARVYAHLNAEPFGISVVEAAAAGCVPIVYHIGGPAECLGDAALTWKDLKQLSTHISELIKDKDLWSKVSEKAKKKAFEFDAAIFEKRIRNILKERLWK